MTSEKLVYNVTEVAQVLNVSRPTAYELLHRPGFPAFRIGNRWLTSKAGLAEWVEKQSGAVPADPVLSGGGQRYG